jgi:hypothetical protein
MGEQFVNDWPVYFVEKDLFSTITKEDVISGFGKVKNQDGKLQEVTESSHMFILSILVPPLLLTCNFVSITCFAHCFHTLGCCR